MKQIAALSVEERKEAFGQAATELGVSPAYIEKDFWVCWVLGVLFRTPGLGEHLTFRGGTSLSKGWQMIARFSEDVDLAIGRAGLAGDMPSPAEAGITTAQRDRRLRELRKRCRAAITEQLVPVLERAAEETQGECRIEAPNLAQARDPFVIEWHYPTDGAAPGGYVQSIVKIELSGRADDWPQETRAITPYVVEALPVLGGDEVLEVPCLRPERTFCEKAALIHEHNTRPEERSPPARQSRHLYDLVRLWERMENRDGLADLFEKVKAHRRVFYGYRWVDYTVLTLGDLRLAPVDDRLTAWERDYRAMESMFFESPPAFDKLIQAIRDIERGLMEL